MLGVGVFFTLSGYLITDLLLEHQASTGRLQLADFWLRRARRLLPALVRHAGRGHRLGHAAGPVPAAGGVRGTVVASALYVSNWWLIAQHSSYFARFGPPVAAGPPVVAGRGGAVLPDLARGCCWLGLRWRRRRSHRPMAAGGGHAAAGAASAVAMALLYHPGYDPTRIYDGTDTRAFALLIGAALALVWPSSRLRGDVTGAGPLGARRRRRSPDWSVFAVLVWRTGEYSAFTLPRRAWSCSRSRPPRWWRPSPRRPAGSARCSAGGRCAGWASAPTASTCGTYPIIVLTTPPGGGDTPARAARRWRRSSPAPPCPGASSRSRSAAVR